MSEPPHEPERGLEQTGSEDCTETRHVTSSGDGRSEHPPAKPSLAEGDVLAGRFRVVRFIAAGGMGEVYEADDLDLSSRVALKMLRPRLAADSTAVERLKREIQLARQVTHRNVCRIFDVFRHRTELPNGEVRDLLGLSMELLEGETLAERIARDGALGPERALPLVRQMAAALHAAHRVGVIHRDFKSSNVILVPSAEGNERLVVTDFGIARSAPRAGGASEPLTEENVVVGTADYMAPEQAQGHEVGPASDIYALGVVMFEMVTGHRPFSGATPAAVVMQRVRDGIPSLRRLAPQLDETWRATIRSCLAVDPGERFPSAAAVVTALGGSVTHPMTELDDGLEVEPVSVAFRQHSIDEHRRRWMRPSIVIPATLVAIAAFALTWRSLVSRPVSIPPPSLALPVQITTWPGLEIDPDVSPDGKAVAFSANRSGSFEIYVKQLASGGREIQITDGGQQSFQPAWSPDGQWIAYATQRPPGVWMIPSLGGRPRQVTDFGSHPAFSPDGSTIAFQSQTAAELSANAVHALPPSTLWLVAQAGGDPRRVTLPGKPQGGHGAPAWSPDGRRLAFAASDRRWSQIWLLDLEDDRLAPLVTDVPVAFDPLISPDGRILYYSAVSSGERYGVWRLPISPRNGEPRGRAECVVNFGLASIRQFAVSGDGRRMIHTALATTSNLWRLPLDSITGEPSGEPHALTTGTGRNSRPAFSPAGSEIAFDRWNVGANQDIWIMSAAGGDARQVTVDPGTDTYASWLQNGVTVAYLSDRDGGWSLWATELASGRSRRLAVLQPDADALRVSPDGARIAYHLADKAGALNLWVAGIDGRGARQLTFGAERMGFACWSPDGRWIAFEASEGENDHLMVVPSAGGEPCQLTDAPGKSWPFTFAPDGDRIVFAGLRNGSWNLWCTARSTGETRQLTRLDRLGSYVRYPAWSPRNDQIVFELAETAGDLWLVEGLE